MSLRLSTFSVEMHAETHTYSAMAISFPQMSDIFSLSLFFPVSTSTIRHCGDKISIPFPPLLLLPSTAGQEVRTTGTGERRERERETRKRWEQKKTLRERGERLREEA